jgi:hypothetical protein
MARSIPFTALSCQSASATACEGDPALELSNLAPFDGFGQEALRPSGERLRASKTIVADGSVRSPSAGENRSSGQGVRGSTTSALMPDKG